MAIYCKENKFVRIQAYSYLKKSSNTIPIGQKTKLNIKIASNTRIETNRKVSTIITNAFINIPIAIEKPIKPFLYSFFQGKKKVFIKRGREKIPKKAELKETKKEIKPRGASKNQNLKNIKGRFK